MIFKYTERAKAYLFLILFISAIPGITLSEVFNHFKTDSLLQSPGDSITLSDQNINFKTFRILTNINEEPDYIRERLYNLQYELGIEKGKELEFLEIYIDKTPEDIRKWNVIINDTSLVFSPSMPWVNLSEESRQLLDNWTGRNDKTILTPDNVDSIVTKKNEMFRVITAPIGNMGENSRLSMIQKDFSYEVIIVDDYPEQVEIEPKPGLVIKRIDANRFRIKLSRFNRAEFERWAESRDDDPYVYTTNITLYDKISNQRSKPINLRFTFGEY